MHYIETHPDGTAIECTTVSDYDTLCEVLLDEFDKTIIIIGVISESREKVLSINKKSVACLVDTGADVSLMRMRISSLKSPCRKVLQNCTGSETLQPPCWVH